MADGGGFGVAAAGNDPGARVGNFRAVCCATFDPDAPIVRPGSHCKVVLRADG